MTRYGALIALTMNVACTKVYHITFDDKSLSVRSGGAIYYNDAPLNGEISREFGAVNARQIVTYRDGYENGPTRTWADNGALTEERFFAKGKKHGIHRGWFPDGRDRFYTEFTDDRYSGEHWTWHANGRVAEYKKYTLDGQILVHKHWRESGQIYRNQVFALNAEPGFPGVKLCNTVKQTVGSR